MLDTPTDKNTYVIVIVIVISASKVINCVMPAASMSPMQPADYAEQCRFDQELQAISVCGSLRELFAARLQMFAR